MTDVLIRDIPDNALTAIDGKARRLGISRQEFLRRRVIGTGGSDSRVTPGDLKRTSLAFCDLADSEIMNRAWE